MAATEPPACLIVFGRADGSGSEAAPSPVPEFSMSGVLLGTHGGATAAGAVRIASLLARRLDLPLVTLVVHQPLPIVDYGFGVAYVPTPEEEDDVRQALVDSVQTQLDGCGVTGSTLRVRTGFVTSEIEAAARELSSDLIVTGLGPHELVDRALGGETALRLAQSAATPVLAVPAAATAIPRQVVAATDLSPTSRRAASVAARWLRASDELHVVYVADPGRHGSSSAPAPERSTVAQRLASFGAQLGAATGVRVECVELSGNPARTLLDYAQRIDADLITVGSHGYGAVKRLLLGSVASKLIRLTTCAILVAPIGSVQ
jgi:nucleotide-binding universal stress UspA family protein